MVVETDSQVCGGCCAREYLLGRREKHQLNTRQSAMSSWFPALRLASAGSPKEERVCLPGYWTVHIPESTGDRGDVGRSLRRHLIIHVAYNNFHCLVQYICAVLKS